MQLVVNKNFNFMQLYIYISIYSLDLLFLKCNLCFCFQKVSIMVVKQQKIGAFLFHFISRVFVIFLIVRTFGTAVL